MPSFNLDKSHTIIAVYLLYIKDKLAYIGRTANLRNRLNSHLNPNEINYMEWKKEITKVDYYICKSIVDSDIIETYLINILRPTFNVDKVFADNTSFKLNLPEKHILNIEDTFLEKINKKLAENESIVKTNSIQMCKLLVEGKCKPEDIEVRYPLIAEGYRKLGGDKLKALGYSSTKIRNEINNLNNKEDIELAIKKLFTPGFYPNKDVKVMLTRLYKDLEINKTAKASEIGEMFNIKPVTKRFGKTTVTGFEIL